MFDNIKAVVDTVYIYREKESSVGNDVALPTKKCSSTHNLPEMRIQTNMENEHRPGGLGLVCWVKPSRMFLKRKIHI